MPNHSTDFLIIGAGIIGVTLALELKKKFPDQKVLVIEKESVAGCHASGRNSGVLHAGFYYTNDSFKARFCREGNAAMQSYCAEHKLKINNNGKLVVTKNMAELAGLQTLYDRGIQNGVSLTMVTEQEARGIEPRVRTVEKAIFSPTTASVNPQDVLNHLIKQAEMKGIQFLYHEKFFSVHAQKKIVFTATQKIHAGFVINAAGLYADKIAKQFGFAKHYHILPFKGLYLYSHESSTPLNTHIYPVPDLNYPFLGVHFTVTVDGKIKIGPTAIPAFWREQYQGFHGFSLSEMAAIVTQEAVLFYKNQFHFRHIALHELKKYSKGFMAREAAYMLDDFSVSHYKTWGKPGIRAQLIDQRNNTLVTDFCFEKDAYSLHILNAVSPAFTCSFPLATYLVHQFMRQ